MRPLIVMVLGLAISVPGGVQADIFSSKSRNKLFKSQTRVLDTRAKNQYAASVRLQPPSVNTPSKWGTGKAYAGRYRGPYLAMAREAARRHGVPEGLFLRLVQQESGWEDIAGLTIGFSMKRGSMGEGLASRTRRQGPASSGAAAGPTSQCSIGNLSDRALP